MSWSAHSEKCWLWIGASQKYCNRIPPEVLRKLSFRPHRCRTRSGWTRRRKSHRQLEMEWSWVHRDLCRRNKRRANPHRSMPALTFFRCGHFAVLGRNAGFSASREFMGADTEILHPLSSCYPADYSVLTDADAICFLRPSLSLKEFSLLL